jgi:hypothetical protein
VAQLAQSDLGPFESQGVFPLTGGDAPLAGDAATGALLVDRNTGEHYINVGTKASPDWRLVTHA